MMMMLKVQKRGESRKSIRERLMRSLIKEMLRKEKNKARFQWVPLLGRQGVLKEA